MSTATLQKKANVETATAPVAHCWPKFSVRALEPIQGQYSLIKPGDFILIDPDVSGADGKLVLVGQRLEPWSGQQGISGVATMLWSDDI